MDEKIIIKSHFDANILYLKCVYTMYTMFFGMIVDKKLNQIY